MALNDNDKELISIINRNTEKGFRLLMTQYKEPVYWHIRRLVVSHTDAQDATQETFVRIFRSLSRFNGDSSLAAWIYRIATNEALRLINRRHDELLSTEETDCRLNRMIADEYMDYSDMEAINLQKAILTLPTKQQLAFNMRYYDELDYAEIAQITDSTAANVKANYHIAKKKITEYMNATIL